MVTENGLADATDTNRSRFIAEHLAELAAKMRARKARASAGVYRQIIDAAGVSTALLASQPAYATPGTMCPGGP